jgi:hemolysin activation/secretion protein
VLGSWLSLGGSAALEVADTTRSQAELALQAEFAVTTNLTLGMDLETDWVVGRETLENSRTVRIGTSAEADFRSAATGPAAGWYLRVRTDGGERSGSTGSGVVGRAELDLEFLTPFSRSVVAVNSVHPRVVLAEGELPEHELFRLGGASSLRGHFEEQFAAPQFVWTNTELRWYLSDLTSVYPLFDLGVLWRVDGWGILPAYGAGARVGTRLGVFGIDYAVAIPENPLHGKLHFGFLGEF